MDSIKLWWAQVIVTPEAKRMVVFNRGTSNGFSGVIPIGGQYPPSSGVGAKLEWKKAQKKPVKKSTSDIINRIIPYRNPFCTEEV